MTDWPSKIVELVRIKERIARLDVDKIFPYTLPAVAADPDRLTLFEERTGVTLDAGHRSFLAAADGWPAFFETQDLLSIEQLAGGEHRDAFTAWMESAPPQARAEGYTAATLLPIAVDLDMPLFAAMPVVDGRVASQVLSLDPSGIIDDFDSFSAYFDSTIAYTERNLADFESGAYRL
ncbi:SMI1/KNR4 family protein [Microbacterium sp. 1P10UB]|uniref:SMI1/KNR4 family protein n=1 Tax=unclassified Microbacterium TaxID=2609290 RepID=UPI0039A395F8